MQREHIISTDVLIIGGGVAGCFAAIEAKRRNVDVIIVDKAYAGKSGSSIMASDSWGYFDPKHYDKLDEAIDLVSKGGEYINNREWTRIILKESYSTFQSIISWGVELPVKLDEATTWWRENIAGGVKGRRGDPGYPYFIQAPLRHRKLAPALRRQAERVGVKIIDRVMIIDLMRSEGERAAGAVGLSLNTGDFYIFRAKATVLAAGWTTFKLAAGYHNLALTGDAEAMAYRSGAEITGKEFQESVHFNLADFPYAWKSNAEIYPAYWRFVDAEGKEINPWELGPNSTVFAFHAGRGPIYWDFDDATPEEKEAIQKYIWKRGNPIELERIGFNPFKGGKYRIFGGCAAGSSLPQSTGIWLLDMNCSSTIKGLYAAGDCCATYCWGAIGRLPMPPAGLTPAAVTGRRAGIGAAEYALQAGEPELNHEEVERLKEETYAPIYRRSGFDPRWVTRLIQSIMVPYYILYIKHERRLQAALTLIEFLRDHMVPRLYARDPHELRLAHEVRNMILNAEMILRASLFRAESRGVHYREDYPYRRDPEWLAWTKIKNEKGEMKLYKEPVPKEWWPDLSKPEEERYPFMFPKFQ